MHLNSEEHWNFIGKVKCVRCGQTMEIEIKKGELVSNTKFRSVLTCHQDQK